MQILRKYKARVYSKADITRAYYICIPINSLSTMIIVLIATIEYARVESEYTANTIEVSK